MFTDFGINLAKIHVTWPKNLIIMRWSWLIYVCYNAIRQVELPRMLLIWQLEWECVLCAVLVFTFSHLLPFVVLWNVGMCEVGVYRISGVSGEIQRLKKAFEKSMQLHCHCGVLLCLVCLCGLKLVYDLINYSYSIYYSISNQATRCTVVPVPKTNN